MNVNKGEGVSSIWNHWILDIYSIPTAISHIGADIYEILQTGSFRHYQPEAAFQKRITSFIYFVQMSLYFTNGQIIITVSFGFLIFAFLEIWE